MYNKNYEILCSITSSIIIITSSYILIKTDKNIIIFITLAGATSLVTRVYRIVQKEYIMNHPLVYMDIFFSILAFGTFIYDPVDLNIYNPIIFAFFLMIIAAIMSWNIFPFYLIQESFYFQLTGHIIITFSLLYYIVFLID